MKYKIGDKVVYTHSQGSYDGKIIAVSPNGSTVTIEFGPTIIPPQMDVQENATELRHSGSYTNNYSYQQYVDTDKNCPVCKNEWKIVQFSVQTWYDCTTCNKTKEQIMKEKKDEGKGLN